ncbi:hypothetical protein BYT27DRAFT_6666751 [Phlegmacium glaucopus]|nr:hypothetical protein BYT27DRAFT_6666751 [Phlegmacium glaucopus]
MSAPRSLSQSDFIAEAQSGGFGGRFPPSHLVSSQFGSECYSGSGEHFVLSPNYIIITRNWLSPDGPFQRLLYYSTGIDLFNLRRVIFSSEMNRGC